MCVAPTADLQIPTVRSQLHYKYSHTFVPVIYLRQAFLRTAVANK